MKKKSLLLGLFLPLFIIGCSTEGASVNSESSLSNVTSESGTNNSSTSASQVVPVTSVALDRNAMQVYTDDMEAELIATVLPENATNKEVNWTSSNTSIATINSEGKITPVSKGTATITAKTVDGNKVATCSVTVKVASTVLNHVLHGLFEYETTNWTDKQMINNSYKTSEYMLLGVRLYKYDEFKIHMIDDSWYGYSNVKNSSHTEYLEQSSRDDNIIINTTGIYDIYCDYNFDASEYPAQHNIYIARVDTTPLPSNVPVRGIELNRTGLYMKTRDETFELKPSILPSNATDREVYWSSSDTSIATVNNGIVKANKDNNSGTTIITATTHDGSFKATCRVYFSAAFKPDYYLTGTIGGYSRTSHTTFPGIPLDASKKHYLFPDVQLVKGDVIYVTGNNGTRIKVNTTTYKYDVDKTMIANGNLDLTKSKDYLTFEARNS